MQLSTDLPCDFKSIRDHLARRAENRLPSNVSPEADAAYLAEKG
jgi:hypothetical protein